MKKKEFLKELRANIQGLPEQDINERIDFYSEAIDDRMEEGLSEEDAVRAMGSIDEIVSQIASDTSLVKLVRNKYKPKRRIRPIEIILLILGFPLWFPLLLTGLILLFVFYLLTWVLVIVTYSVEVSLVGVGILGFYTFLSYLSTGEMYWFSLGFGITSIGASLLFIFICVLATKISIKLAKHILVGLKRFFIGGKKNA